MSSASSLFWPLRDLRVRTERLELRLPSYDELVGLGQLAFDGIHDPAEMPFGVPWTDAEPQERARATMQWHWRAVGSLTPDDWHLPLVVFENGTVVGTQELVAYKFSVRHEVSTGSWLGRRHQGRGIGTEMRAAVLELAFAGLGALWATTTAFEDNHASNGVSRRLGYVLDGNDIAERRGVPATLQRYRLSAATWLRQARPRVQVHGVEACRPLLGAD